MNERMGPCFCLWFIVTVNFKFVISSLFLELLIKLCSALFQKDHNHA